MTSFFNNDDKDEAARRYDEVAARVTAFTWPVVGLSPTEFEQMAFEDDDGFEVSPYARDPLIKMLEDRQVIHRLTIFSGPRVYPASIFPAHHGRPNLQAIGIESASEKDRHRRLERVVADVGYSVSMVYVWLQEAAESDFVSIKRGASVQIEHLRKTIQKRIRAAVDQGLSLEEICAEFNRLWPRTHAEVIRVLPWLQDGRTGAEEFLATSGPKDAKSRPTQIQRVMAALETAGLTGLSKTAIRKLTWPNDVERSRAWIAEQVEVGILASVASPHRYILSDDSDGGGRPGRKPEVYALVSAIEAARRAQDDPFAS